MYDIDTEEDIISKATSIVQSRLRNGKKNIPIQPRLHAQAVLDLSILANETRSTGIVTVALYLALLLDKSNPSHVEIRQSSIAKQIKLSTPSIIKALSILEEMGYIKNVGKSAYYISPKLAFYGSNIEWSIALQCDEVGESHEEYKVKRDRVNKQIAKTQESIVCSL